MLKKNEVHLWYATIDKFKAQQNALAILSDDEKGRLNRFKFEKDKNVFLLSRYLLRNSLSRYVKEISAQQWRFKKNEFGRIFVDNTDCPDWVHFNLSHSGELVICAISGNKNIGVDAENLQKSIDFLSIAESHFTARELKHLQSLESKDLAQCFFQYWTLKEAYLKAIGKGLRHSLNSISFDVSGDRIEFYQDSEEEIKKWEFRLLNTVGDYQIAVAVAIDTELCIKEFEFI